MLHVNGTDPCGTDAYHLPGFWIQNSTLKNTILMDNLTIQVNSGDQSGILFPGFFSKTMDFVLVD